MVDPRLPLLALALSACGGSQASPAGIQDAKSPILEVCLSISAAFSDANVCIERSGAVTYTAYSDAGQTRDTSRITAEQWTSLVALIEDSGFLDHEEPDRNEKLLDANTVSIDVIYRDGTKSVSCTAWCSGPAEQVDSRIRDLWGKDILVLGF